MKICKSRTVFYLDVLKEYPCLNKFNSLLCENRNMIIYTSEDESRILIEAIFKHLKYSVQHGRFIIDVRNKSLLFCEKRNLGPYHDTTYIKYTSIGNIFILSPFDEVSYMVGIDKRFRYFVIDNLDNVDKQIIILWLKFRLAKLIR